MADKEKIAKAEAKAAKIKEKKLRAIASRFTPETVIVPRNVPKTVKDPKTGKTRKVMGVEQVETEVTVAAAGDFNALVQAEFNFPKNQIYDVKLDLWSGIQENLDQHFSISTTPMQDTLSMIANFQKVGRSVGMVKCLLNYFRDKGLVSVGNFVIRFADKEPRGSK
jgi:hypothetical protein